MTAHQDHQNSRSMLSSLNGYHGQMTTLQPPLPEPPSNMKPPVPRLSEDHGLAAPFNPPFLESNVMSFLYYEGYTIRPDDFAFSEDRWTLPPKKSIPATQEDLHTEVIRQRQSGRTACRELEDCHGPKRQYIDRLIRERNASTSLGHFEVAQLRLERIPKDSGKAFNRNSGWNHHARDYKQKDPTKPRQKTVYMHIILQFIKKSNKRLGEIPPNNLTSHNPNVCNSHPSATTHASDEDILIPPTFSDELCPALPGASRRPLLARGYPYTTGSERATPPPSNRYISQSTQTSFPVHTRPHCDCCGRGNSDDAALEKPLSEDKWTSTTSKVEDEMRRNSPSTDDEVRSTDDSTVVHEVANESTEEESRGIDEYEKPTWFQNLRPVKTPSITDDEPDACDQQDDGESVTTYEGKDTDHGCAQEDQELMNRHEEAEASRAQYNVASLSGEFIGQRALGFAAGHTKSGDNDQSPQKDGASKVTGVRELDSIDKHANNDPMNTPTSEYLSNLPRSAHQGKLPPSERYKPRPPLNLVRARPSLTRSSTTYDRRSSKRVSFQQALMPLYTPPSTTTSSPVSLSASPQLPFRTISAKPPPVSIPPGQYTPVASSSPVSPSSPPTTRKPYACLEPTCDSSFDHPYDRERHERQHEIGDPPYSQCPICHHSRSSGAILDVELREMLIAHMNRRH